MKELMVSITINKINMNIYKHCLEKVANGSNFSISFEERTLVLDGKKVINHGEYKGKLHFEPNGSPDDVLGVIEDLYCIYKNSIPSEKTDSKRRNYFKALKEEELTDDDMLYGEKRMESKFNLEYYILENIINGSLYWKDEWGKWFWQSQEDKDLVILRSWIEGV